MSIYAEGVSTKLEKTKPISDYNRKFIKGYLTMVRRLFDLYIIDNRRILITKRNNK